MNLQSDGCAHGYCVVYSTADRSSFMDAERRLQILWAAGHTARRAVILVGNKADLARSRVINTDGKYNCNPFHHKAPSWVTSNCDLSELIILVRSSIYLQNDILPSLGLLVHRSEN